MDGLLIKYSDKYEDRDLLYPKVEHLVEQNPIFTITQSQENADILTRKT